jgi:carbonic anhydrase
MSNRTDLLTANVRYAATFTHGDLPAPPARHIAILTCMDARLDPAKFLGLSEGEAHVIRNAGGRANPDALNALVISQQYLGTNEVVVIHHTRCGMTGLRDEAVQKLLTKRFGGPIEPQQYGGFDDLAQSVRDDVATIRADARIPDDLPISGFIYDVETGRLTEVD